MTEHNHSCGNTRLDLSILSHIPEDKKKISIYLSWDKNFTHNSNYEELDKVPSGARIPPTSATTTFLKSTKYVALTLEMAVVCYMLYYIITLKKFNHT